MGEAKRKRASKNFMETRMPVSVCPSCGKPNDAVTSTTGRYRPSKGDVAICLTCGHISVIGADMKLRPPTDAEMYEIAGDPRIVKVQKVRGQVMKGKQ